jgi:NDP-sugar pyrophosphorylase family protein
MPPAAILAGGLATRLYPVTRTIPKSMLEAAGRPFIDHQLRLLKANGIQRVVLCLGNLADPIQDYVQDGRAYGLQVDYSRDGEQLVGTGGALRKALPLLGETFFVLYGDSYLPIPFAPVAEAFTASGRQGLMTVFRNEGRWDKSNVCFRDQTIVRYDKAAQDPDMAYIDYGLGMLKAQALDEIPGERFDLAALYQTLLSKNQLAGFEVFQRFYEIGSQDGLKEFEDYIKNQ